MGEPLRVLLVDDEPDVLRLLTSMLAPNSAVQVVGEAPDGTSALEQVGELDVDVVVLDLHLPDLSGKDVLTRIRDADDDVHVIIFTGHPPPATTPPFDAARGVVGKNELTRLVALLDDLACEPRPRATVSLRCDHRSARAARRFLEEHLVQWGCQELVPDAALVVSELVSNAVEHARTGCSLSVSLSDGLARIAVTDWGGGTPEPLAPLPDRSSGRGLNIVSSIATAWGIDPADGGKTVWAELST